jgi:hypothetical protein
MLALTIRPETRQQLRLWARELDDIADDREAGAVNHEREHAT